jgi:DNA repair protein RecO (recombination protein O)
VVPSRERVYRTEAIVLRRTDLGEADRLLTVFTPDRGKVKLVAKGARRPASRKSGHVELFSRGQFLVAVGRDLDILTQAETLEPYRALREDLLRTTYAYYVAELVDAFTAERDENRPLFDLLQAALGWVCTAPDLQLMARYYELHILGLVGYQPQLFMCGSCRKMLEPEVNFLSVAGGSVLCTPCGRDRPGTLEMSVNALKVLRFLQTREWETCRLLRLSAASHAELERSMNQYVTYHLESRLKSLDFLHHLRLQMIGDRAASLGEADSLATARNAGERP